MIPLPTTAQKSRFVFDFRPERSLLATEWKLDTVTGQAATFVRASASNSTDSNGDTISVAHSVPRFEWGVLDFDDDETTVGVRINGDALSYPFLVKPQALTLYVRLQRKSAAATDGVVFAIGGATGVRLVITESASGTYTATYNDGTTSFTSTTVRPYFSNAAVELRCVLKATGLRLYYSLFGDTEEAGSLSAALTFPAAWSSPTVYIGSTAGVANPSNNVFVRPVIGLGDVPISAFRPALRTRAPDPAALKLVETSPDFFEYVATGPADLELVETSPGVFESLAAGTSPASARANVYAAGTSNFIVY